MNKAFPNLEAEMARMGIQRKDLAEKLGVRPATISDKINGKFPFTLDEVVAIKKSFFPNLSLEYLFSNEIAVPA